MNTRADTPLRSQTAQILKRAPRKMRLPASSTPCDDLAVPVAVKVSDPYRDGDKWRLVLFEGTKRTAKLFDNYQTAIRVKETILAAAQGIADSIMSALWIAATCIRSCV